MTADILKMSNAELDAIAVYKDRHNDIGLDVVCMAHVQARPIEWLWQNWIAIGKVSMLSGEGGQGKSTVLCDLAARTTNGDRWPDQAAATAPGTVIILAAEDDAEDTIKPRLVAAGADVSCVYNIRSARNDDRSRRTFNLQVDLERLEREIVERGNVRLVIIDPVSSYLGKGVDSHKNADVRSVLEPIGEMAARTRVAVVCNNHFSKGGGTANNRAIGSVGFINYVRAAFIVTPDAENEGRLLLMPSKMNIAPIKYGLAYRIESYLLRGEGDQPEIMTSRIAWETQPVTMSADAALAAHEGTGESRSMKAEAIDFLNDALSAGPRKVPEVMADARAAGISTKPIKDARKALGVRAIKGGMTDGWLLELPKGTKGSEGAHLKDRASSEEKVPFATEPDPDDWSFNREDDV